MIPKWYGATATLALTPAAKPLAIEVSRQVGVWAVEVALVLGILTVAAFAWRRMIPTFVKASHAALAGCLLASMNTASEFGFGAVMAALPGFAAIQAALSAIPNPLVNEAITVTTLAGVTGSASGGLSLALAAMAEQFKTAALAAHIPFEVLHRVVGDGGRRDGHAAAQRRDHHAAGDHRPDPSPVVRRYFRDHLHQDDRGVRGDRGVLPDGDRLKSDFKSQTSDSNLKSEV